MTNKEISDLTGIGKVIDSEIAKETYKDAASPAMKEIGGFAQDAVKTFRLFTAPIQLLVSAEFQTLICSHNYYSNPLPLNNS
jgi:hypothetical protein